MFISGLFTSCALFIRLSFRGTISDIVTVFVSDFRVRVWGERKKQEKCSFSAKENVSEKSNTVHMF